MSRVIDMRPAAGTGDASGGPENASAMTRRTRPSTVQTALGSALSASGGQTAMLATKAQLRKRAMLHAIDTRPAADTGDAMAGQEHASATTVSRCTVDAALQTESYEG